MIILLCHLKVPRGGHRHRRQEYGEKSALFICSFVLSESGGKGSAGVHAGLFRSVQGWRNGVPVPSGSRSGALQLCVAT